MKLPPISTQITENPTQLLINLNSQLSKLNRSQHYTDALELFRQIQSSHHLKPDHYTLSTALTTCANIRNTLFGNQLHAHVIRAGFRAYPHVGNSLLALYAKVQDLSSTKWVFDEIQSPDVYSWTTVLSASMKMGDFAYARELFDCVPEKNVATWNAMITGCVENEDVEGATGFFIEMHKLGVRPDNYSYASVLSLCGYELIDYGRQVHGLVVRRGFLLRTSVMNSLLRMYFNCGNVMDAYKIFEGAGGEMCDHITYNIMMGGMVSVGRDREALSMFVNMQESGLRPTDLTFVTVMNSCLSKEIGNQMYGVAIKMGFEACTSVSNATITMYSSCGDLQAAQMVFERLDDKDIVSWNAMISGYAEGNFYVSAFLAFQQMLKAGVKADEYTIGCLSASTDLLVTVEMIQALASKNGLMSAIQVSNALISAYAKHGKIIQACQIFDGMFCRNLVSWNAIISGFLFNGFPSQGLEQFSALLMSEIRPDVYTLSIVLSICASISELARGKQVHSYIIRFGFGTETSMGNTLITLYSKCGVLDWSLRVFSFMNEKDVVSWNGLISALAQHGKGKEAVEWFKAMQNSSHVNPDEATFTTLLSACSHAGLIEDALEVFNSMVSNYGFTPGTDHFSCIVDLLGRGGYLDEAESIISDEHFYAHANIWWALFSACAAHGNLRLGRIAAEYLLKTEKDDPTILVVLSNIYADAGHWEEAAFLRELMRKNKINKHHGWSSIRL